MSLLKQTVLAVVTKGETVLNSYDAGDSGATEGYVYECRFAPKEYVPSTGEGFNIATGDLMRFTTVDGNGDAYTAIMEAKADFNLTVNGDINPINHLAVDTAQLEAFSTEAEVYKTGNKYYNRAYELRGTVNTTTTDAYTNQNVVITDVNIIPTLDVEAELQTIFAGGGSPSALDFTFPSASGLKRFASPYFGSITSGGGTVVPNGAWFYYDGSDIGAGALAGSVGYYLNVTGADFDPVAGINDAVYADQAAVSGLSLLSYVWAANTGGGQDTLSNSIGYSLSDTEVADVLDAAQIDALTAPTVNNEYWTEVEALGAPLSFAGAVASDTDTAILETTTANELTDLVYWNLLSQNFIEDYNRSVGSAGVTGADPAGIYASSYVAAAADATVRAIDIESVVNATATTEARIVSTDHEFSTGDSITIAGVSTLDGTYTITVVDGNSFKLDGTVGAALVTYSDGGTATENGSTDLVWRETFPPISDQTLLYRY
jgi:hypothetical protein